jgi:hypothetical protein
MDFFRGVVIRYCYIQLGNDGLSTPPVHYVAQAPEKDVDTSSSAVRVTGDSAALMEGFADGQTD